MRRDHMLHGLMEALFPVKSRVPNFRQMVGHD